MKFFIIESLEHLVLCYECFYGDDEKNHFTKRSLQIQMHLIVVCVLILYVLLTILKNVSDNDRTVRNVLMLKVKGHKNWID